MKKTQTSTTAQGMAAIRAVEAEKPAGQRICYDPFARQFVGPGYFLLERALNAYAEWRSPGLIGFVVSRTRYIDDYLEVCLDHATAQVVILGAGLDSRAYRFPRLRGPVKVFEVDHPATQAAKIARLKRILNEIPNHVTFVPIDFNEETLDKLAGYGYDRALKSLFIWEGVVHYLNPAAVDATLARVRSNATPGSAIIFDYIYPSGLSGKHRREEVKLSQWTHWLTGEALVFGIEKGQIADFLTRRGFTSVVDACAADFKRLYCTGLNQNRAIAEIYAIVHATVP
jgi:methyltransferase (TIGR00027 family)